MTICIVDTSVLDELLNVPGWANHHEATLKGFDERLRAREQFLLPLATLIEAGNHIAQVTDGAARRDRAERFVKLARDAIAGESPFAPLPFPNRDDVAAWLETFPEEAMRGVGLADKSMVALWERQRDLNPMRRVYVWSLDNHLISCDTGPR